MILELIAGASDGKGGGVIKIVRQFESFRNYGTTRKNLTSTEPVSLSLCNAKPSPKFE